MNSTFLLKIKHHWWLMVKVSPNFSLSHTKSRTFYSLYFHLLVNPSSPDVLELKEHPGWGIKTSSLCLPPRPPLKVTFFKFFFKRYQILYWNCYIVKDQAPSFQNMASKFFWKVGNFYWNCWFVQICSIFGEKMYSCT